MSVARALDASPSNVLRALRGEIIDAPEAYPHVLHVHVRDSSGGLWRLATQDAEWSPPDPTDLVGRSIDHAKIDEKSGELRFNLSDGSVFAVLPAGRESSGDPPNWELIPPDGLALEFGPGLRWQIGSADDLATSRG